MRVVRLVEVAEDRWRGREEDVRLRRWNESEIPSALFKPGKAKRERGRGSADEGRGEESWTSSPHIAKDIVDGPLHSLSLSRLQRLSRE